MPRATVIVNTDVLDRISGQAAGKAEQVLQKLAEETEVIIKDSFSPESPSAPGDPPGVDSGNLKNGIIAEPGEEPNTWVVHDQVEYGVHLEYGTEKMAARPWLLPAVEQVAANAPEKLIKVIQDE